MRRLPFGVAVSRRGLLGTVVLGAVGVATGCAELGKDSTSRTSAAVEYQPYMHNPFISHSLWVDPNIPTKLASRRAHGKNRKALHALGVVPQAYWLTDPDIGRVTSKVHAACTSADADGSLALFSVYCIPNRDLGSFTAGGVANAADYKKWIDAICTAKIAVLGPSIAVAVVEPDAVKMLPEMKGGYTGKLATERKAALSYATDKLSKSGFVVYLDGGNSHSLPPAQMARQLVDAGIRSARGFSTNVANFYTTAAERSFGTQVANAVHRITGQPAPRQVIDTSRNGLGPWDGPNAWCNPPGRAAGMRPTRGPSKGAVDAYLWVKRPGEGDGGYNLPDPSGGFSASYAVGLARRAKWYSA